LTEDPVTNQEQDDVSNLPRQIAELSPSDGLNIKTNITPQDGLNKQPCSCGGKESCSCKSETAMSGNSYVYAIGRVQVRFPTMGIEKEFAQAIGKVETPGLSDRQAMQSALSQKHNRYIARQMCWVLTVEGLETYILTPRDPTDFDLLLDALSPSPRPTDINVIIGVRGPMATPETCNGLLLPIVIVDQIYSFDIDALLKSIPKPESTPAKQFNATAEELFYRTMQMADNAGATDEHRALNYLSVRYPAIYEKTSEMHGQESSLSAVEVRPSRLSAARKIVDVVFSYTNRKSDVIEKYFVRVDITEEFPFLASKMSPYFER
jgi:hypothetical protein